MSPPELTPDRPVAFLGEPVKVRFGVAFREDLHTTVSHGIHRALSQIGHADEPLVVQERLNDRFGAVADWHFMLMIFHFEEDAGGFQVRDDHFTCFEHLHADVFFRHRAAQCGFFGRHVGEFSAVPGINARFGGQ